MTRLPPASAAPETLRAIEQDQMAAVGYLLIRCGQLWNQMGITRVNASAGRVKLRQAHTRLFPYLTNRDGIRVTDLARRLDVSKQAIQPLVAELEKAGLVVVRLDPADRRALRVHLTDAGAAAFAAGNTILKTIETELTSALGSRRLDRLRHDLKALLHLLENRSTPPARAGSGTPGGKSPTAVRTPRRNPREWRTG